MRKKLSVLVVLFCMLCQSTTALATPQSYTPGDRTMVFSFNEARSLQNATIEEGTLSLAAGGSGTFDVLLRADMVTAELSYTAEQSSTVTLTAEEVTTSAQLSEGSATARVSVSLRRGSHALTLTADSAVKLHSITFSKAKQTTGVMATYLTEQSNYEEALQTTIVLQENASLFKSSGAMRYIDYDNPTQTPL